MDVVWFSHQFFGGDHSRVRRGLRDKGSTILVPDLRNQLFGLFGDQKDTLSISFQNTEFVLFILFFVKMAVIKRATMLLICASL